MTTDWINLPEQRDGGRVLPEHVIQLQDAIGASEQELADVVASQERGLVAPNPGIQRLNPPASVMASPPTLTWEAFTSHDNPGTSIANARRILATDPAFQYTCGLFELHPESYPYNLGWERYLYFDGWDPVSAGYRVSFETDSDVFSIVMMNADVDIWVDHQPISASIYNPANDGLTRCLTVTFAAAEPRGRLIELRFNTVSRFGGLKLGPLSSVWYPRVPVGPRVTFIGDSVSLGTGTSADRGLARKCGDALGWRDVWVACVGGIGYANPGSYQKIGSYIESSVIPYEPDIIVMNGGRNDNTAPYMAALPTEVNTIIDLIEAELPDTQIIIVSPFYPTYNPDAGVTSARNNLQSIASTRGLPFIDPTAGLSTGTADKLGQWITGNGRVGSTNGSGNSDIYTSSDTAHPSEAGHAYLGYRLAAEIAKLMPIGVS